MSVEKVSLEVSNEVKIFKETKKSYGERGPKDKIKFVFELSQGVTEDQIDYIYPDCGACTQVIVKGNKIVGTIDLSKAMPQYNDGLTPVNKTVFVKLNDGKRQFIPDSKTKLRKVNKDVKIQRLGINCIVKK